MKNKYALYPIIMSFCSLICFIVVLLFFIQHGSKFRTILTDKPLPKPHRLRSAEAHILLDIWNANHQPRHITSQNLNQTARQLRVLPLKSIGHSGHDLIFTIAITANGTSTLKHCKRLFHRSYCLPCNRLCCRIFIVPPHPLHPFVLQFVFNFLTEAHTLDTHFPDL